MTTPATLPRRVLGRTGIAVMALGVGCWPIGGPDVNLGMPMGWADIDESTAVNGLETAYALGANLFDTADVYGHGRSERLVGRLVAQVPRDQLVLTSKVGYFSGTAAHGYEAGHMRHQLEQTLTNLGTDYLDIYFLHQPDFGPDDDYLDGAVGLMRQFRADGVIRAIGMRGPHRFALDRLTTPAGLRGDKIARFKALFDVIEPDVLAVRDNLLTPHARSAGVFALADIHDCGVLINKPLSQGLLTGTYRPDQPRVFGAGDHRARKSWFTPPAVEIIDAGLDQLRTLVGRYNEDLVRVALWACLSRTSRAAVLTGFSHPEQIRMNVACLHDQPNDTVLDTARTIMAQVQARLDALGEVFLDEHSVLSNPTAERSALSSTGKTIPRTSGSSVPT
jgi:aryl-alcohol dehydrogenase-like predicted oxidoreductase